MPQQLALFTGPKAGQSYSSVVLDRSQAPPRSPSLFCTGMRGGPGNEATRETTSAAARVARLAFSFVLGLLSLCSFYSAVSTAWSAVTLDFTFLFQAPPLFAASFVGHFENTIGPYQQPLKFHFKNSCTNYPLDLLQEHGCET